MDNKMHQLDGYQMLERIGGGTYGSVCKATQLSTGKTVAVKIIDVINNSPQVAQKHLKMLAREVHILYKFSKMGNNTFTIQLLDMIVNEEALTDP